MADVKTFKRPVTLQHTVVANEVTGSGSGIVQIPVITTVPDSGTVFAHVFQVVTTAGVAKTDTFKSVYDKATGLLAIDTGTLVLDDVITVVGMFL